MTHADLPQALVTGGTIGILGGGQLGRMLSVAAARLGYRTHIYDPGAHPPAGQVAQDVTTAAFDDVAALERFAAMVDIITYEFENIPTRALDLLQDRRPINPGRQALWVSQDRLVEKRFLRDLGLATAPFVPVASPEDLTAALAQVGMPSILKTRRFGYDGKGQARLETGDDYEAAHRSLGHAPCILEALVPFVCEVSVIIARDHLGASRCYDVPRNEHVNGILRRSFVPANVDARVADRSCRAATALADALDYVGVLALEFFVLADGSLLANEFAPRVHNSGHWTPEACATGQFEQHVRAVAGWPLGDVTRFHDVEMANLLGDEALAAPEDLLEDAVLTLYGKRDAKPGRKMGHLVKRLS